MKARRNDDAGESLVESLVSLAIIGIAVTGLTAGFGILGAARTAQDGAVTHAAAAQVQGVLRSWAQTLSRPADAGPGYVYTPCASTSAFPQPTGLPGGWTASIESVQYWSATGWAGTCDVTNEGGLQRLTLAVTSAGATYSASTQKLTVVVRRPCKDAAC